METAMDVTPPPIRKTGEARLETFSMRLWGVDWSKHFPLRSKNNEFECRRVTFHEISSYLVPTDSSVNRNKRAFYEECADSFGFYELRSQRLIGVGLANPSDPSTYYIRFAHISDACRGNGLFANWIRALTDTMRTTDGVERIEVEIIAEQPHMPMIYARLGYRICGTTFTDRWGGLIRLSAHFGTDAEEAFMKRFCQPNAPQAQTTQGGVS